MSKAWSKFDFKSVLTQNGACNTVGGCSGVDNCPNTEWNQLNDALNAAPNNVDANAFATNDICYWTSYADCFPLG